MAVNTYATSVLNSTQKVVLNRLQQNHSSGRKSLSDGLPHKNHYADDCRYRDKNDFVLARDLPRVYRHLLCNSLLDLLARDEWRRRRRQ